MLITDTIILSDLHLGSKECNAGPLLQFLKNYLKLVNNALKMSKNVSKLFSEEKKDQWVR